MDGTPHAPSSRAAPDTAAGYDHQNPKFWERSALEAELTRVYDICNGCRLCFNLCPSFPTLFSGVDALDEALHGKDAVVDDAAKPEGEHAADMSKVQVATENLVSMLDAGTRWTVVDQCYNCKLCFPKCPYVPPHEFAVDFPRLMLRAKMVRAKEEGVTLQDRFLGAIDTVGPMMTATAGLSNALQHSRWSRVLMEKAVGIHRDRNLPDWASQTFEAWWRSRPPTPGLGPSQDQVALFYTCSANYNDPDLAKAAVEVLEHNRIDVSCPSQRCCGMPFLDGGDLPRALENAKENVASLLPEVRAGRKVLSPGPTCTFMMKQEYPELLKTPEAKEVAAAVQDAGDYLCALNKAGKLDRALKAPLGRVAYHVPCHNKVQNVGYRGAELLGALGADVTRVDRCCGMDGTWGMKKEFFELSLDVAKKATAQVQKSEAEVVVTDCPLAGLQLTQTTGRPAYHPLKVLRAAYRGVALKS